jgi:hypothetical protein
MKTSTVVAGILAVCLLNYYIYVWAFSGGTEFSVCVTNSMKVDVSCHKLELDGTDFSVGNMGSGGMGCIERIHGHKIPDNATIKFSPILKGRNNDSATVVVDMKGIPKDANGKVIFTIVDENTVTVRYEPYIQAAVAIPSR